MLPLSGYTVSHDGAAWWLRDDASLYAIRPSTEVWVAIEWSRLGAKTTVEAEQAIRQYGKEVA